MNNKFSYALTLLLGTAVITGCSDEAPITKAPVSVETVKISDEIFGSLSEFPAVIQASDQSDLAFRVSGELISLPAIGGKRVKKGDVLASIDPADFKRDLADAKATYELAQKNYQRAEALLEKGSIAASEYDTLKAEYKISEAALGLAKVRLNFTELKAPKDGIIGSVYVENFENVVVGEPIVTINSLKTLDVVVDVAEHLSAVAQKSAGKLIHRVKIDGVEGEFDASTYEVESEKDSVSKTYKVTLRIERPSKKAVLPGMSAVVLVDMNKVSMNAFSGLVLPSSAVLFEPSKEISAPNSFVWKLSDDGKSVVKQAVEVQQLAQYGVEIKSGIAPGDVIVVYGQGLYEGASVNVVKTREIKG